MVSATRPDKGPSFYVTPVCLPHPDVSRTDAQDFGKVNFANAMVTSRPSKRETQTQAEHAHADNNDQSERTDMPAQ